MSEPKAMVKRRRWHLWRLTTKLGWHMPKHDNWITGRIHHLLIRSAPWWDWGHRVMILTGTCVGGNYDSPRPGTWWYRLGPAKRMWRTKYPRHPLSSYQVVKSWEQFRDLTVGLNEDQMYEWQAIGLSQDDELHLGHQFWGGTFYGLTAWDTALLRRYLRQWHRKNWWGLRSWLYSQALHAHVHRAKPFSCKAVPPRDSGGYSHWRCQLKRRHDGLHRVNSYVWGEVGGEDLARVVYAPQDELVR